MATDSEPLIFEDEIVTTNTTITNCNDIDANNITVGIGTMLPTLKLKSTGGSVKIGNGSKVESGATLELESTGGSVKIESGFKVESGASFIIK